MAQFRRKPTRIVDGVLLLDKPEGVSSNTALQTVKHMFQAAKAGHTGSLDPIATGLLPICFGQATKLSGLLLDGDKRYRVLAQLGIKTNTADREGEVIAKSDPTSVTADAIEAVLATLQGPQQQIPPMYSALKHQGQRLYQLAREGIEVERPPRAIVLHKLQLLSFGDGRFELEVACSKGTYIRSLVEDVAAALGQCAHVQELRRIGAAPFNTPAMIDFDQLQLAEQSGPEALDALLLPPVAAVSDMAKIAVDDDMAFYLARGQAVHIAGLPGDESFAVISSAGDLIGVGRRTPEGLLAPSRWFV